MNYTGRIDRFDDASKKIVIGERTFLVPTALYKNIRKHHQVDELVTASTHEGGMYLKSLESREVKK